MSAYVICLIWVLSALLCDWIARRRSVRAGVLLRTVVVLLGPFAIPLAFLVRPHSSVDAS